MPKLGTWKCKICKLEVKEIGAYAKIALGSYAHLHCFETQVRETAFENGRRAAHEAIEFERKKAEEDKQRQEEQERIDTEVRLRNYVQTLKRCVACGRRMIETNSSVNSNIEIRAIDPEAVQASVGALARRDTCANCVEAERIARNEARSPNQTPKQEPEKKEDKPRDRFGVIELD